MRKSNMHPDEQKLKNAGYITKRFTQYHFQVKKSGGKDIVNVWPTACKILMKYTPGPARFYTDIVEATNKLLQPTRKSLKEQAAELRSLFPLPGRVDEVLEWYKQDPINNVREYAKII